ncbi:hypothetical protein HMPREF0262_00617 [Clostridium sp. ATCC 29733]|nr:hypothetical protein HMPREF0262_00617 [Clostridium sp. ATCC 29733]
MQLRRQPTPGGEIGPLKKLLYPVTTAVRTIPPSSTSLSAF